MIDLLIRGGWVVDGTGSPRRRADVRVNGGRIVEIAPDEPIHSARRVIDAEGMIVAPGFVDVHTHYDAQLLWDPAATPSILHGVTTILGGNCGFSIAPIDPASAEYLVPMLATVEGMPPEALANGLDIRWSSFAEYLDQLDGTLAINAGFLVGHSAIRRMAMGPAAVGNVADEQSLGTMIDLVHHSIEGGALGFSTSNGQLHFDHNGDFVPSRYATTEETLSLCRAAGEHAGTSLEAIPTSDHRGIFDAETQMFLVAMSLAAGRPVNWNALTLQHDTDVRASRLQASTVARAAGGKVVALAPSAPSTLRISLEVPVLWQSIPGWAETMSLPLEERLKAFKQSDVRRRLAEGAVKTKRALFDWSSYTINDVPVASMAALVGRRIGDIAGERNRDPFDVLCDIAVEGGLRVGFGGPVMGDSDVGWSDLVRICRDWRVVVGASDAGAHIDMISGFAMYSTFLGEAVRARGLLDFEEAINLLAARPAELYGLKGRGTLTAGGHADIVIFDPDEIGHGRIEVRHDLPGGAKRIFAESSGIRQVIVNGTVAVESGVLTGSTSGQTIRSGRDTVNPPMS